MLRASHLQAFFLFFFVVRKGAGLVVSFFNNFFYLYLPSAAFIGTAPCKMINGLAKGLSGCWGARGAL